MSRKDLVKLNLEKLKKIGEKVTEGPWRADEDYNCRIYTSAEELPKGRTYGYGCDETFVCDLNDGEYHEYLDIREQQANAKFIVEARNNWNAMIAALEEAKALLQVCTNLEVLNTQKPIYVSYLDITKEWLERFEDE